MKGPHSLAPVLLCCVVAHAAPQGQNPPERSAKQILEEIRVEMAAIDHLLDSATRSQAGQTPRTANSPSGEKTKHVDRLIVDTLDRNTQVVKKIDELLELFRKGGG